MYHGWIKRRLLREDRVRVSGFELIVPPTVFHPSFYRSSKVMAGFLGTLPLEGMRILDIGCGSGILSLACARAGAVVTAIDVNPEAVRATRVNASANKLPGRIEVFESDLFSSVDLHDKIFDIAIANPPFFAGKASGISERAWKAGEGLQYFHDFAQGLRAHLDVRGKAYLILSSDCDIPLIFKMFRQFDYSITSVYSRRLMFEELEVLEIHPLA